MKYVKKEFGSYNLHMIHTDKFKTITIEIIFQNKIEKKKITITNFLASMLSYSTKKFPTKNSLMLQMQDLYSVKLFPSCYRIGKCYNVDFNMCFLNEKYTEIGMYEKSLELLKNIIFDPNVNFDSFDETSFNIVKNDEKSQIERIKEDPRKYSIIRMLQSLNEKEVFSYSEYGYINDLEKITPNNLYQFYKEFINNSVIDIFIVGNIDFKETENLIKDKFKFRIFKKYKINPVLNNIIARKKTQIIFEKEKTLQSKLSIGCVINNMTKFEREYVLNIYNLILGATADSKFFKNIREKYSICYYISSIGNKLDNLLIITSGINKENFDKTFSLIKKEMNDIQNGIFTDEEIENAKKYYLSLLEEALDNPNQIISSYYAMDLWKVDSLEKRKVEINKVTREDVINFSKKIYIDTVFLLGGDNSD